MLVEKLLQGVAMFALQCLMLVITVVELCGTGLTRVLSYMPEELALNRSEMLVAVVVSR